MKIIFMSILSSFVFSIQGFSQTESYYTDNNCMCIYFKISSSKLKIYYGNGMEEEVSGDPQILTATVTNKFLKNGYILHDIIGNNDSSQLPGDFFFFVRKEQDK
jgi:hypothetical protein